MNDIFSPIFLLSLLLCVLSEKAGIYFAVLDPIIIIVFSGALISYFSRYWSAAAAKILSSPCTNVGRKDSLFRKIAPGFRFRLSYLLIALAIALAVTFGFHKRQEDFSRKSALAIPQDEYISIEGELKNYPEIGREDSALFIKVRSLEYNRERKAVDFNAWVNVKGNLKHLYKGDYIQVGARVYGERLNRNFFPNPFENYLLYKGIHFSGYCKSTRMLTVLKRGHPAWRIIGRWRNNIRGAIERKYLGAAGEMSKRGVFLEAILIGDRGRIENEQKNELLDAGVYHLVSISGAHIGIIAAFLLFFFKKLKISFEVRYMATAFFLIVFLILSGFSIPAQRAVLMAILIFTARILYLEIDVFNIISFCGLLLLFNNPAEFLDPGFILTFALTAAIVKGRQIFLPFLQKPRFKKIPTTVKELVCANFSASLISLPLALFFFKRYSFAGFFSGLLLLPLAAVITALGILLIPLAPVSQVAADILLFVIDGSLCLFFQVNTFFSRGVNLTFFRAAPSLLSVVVILAAFFVIPQIRDRELRSKKILLAITVAIFILTTLFISLPLFHYKPARLEVFFLDVGQGDSQIVVFPGGEALLIDGGGSYYSDFEVGKQVLLPFILQQRIKIKWAAVSHYHPDHARGLCEILAVIKPEELWLSSEAQEDSFYKSLVKQAEEGRKIKIKKLDSSFSKVIGDCRVECLFPRQFIIADYSHNNHSQVLQVSDRYHSFLFSGDIEAEIEEYLVRNSCKKLRSDVLKVPHHGSKSSSSLVFLRCVDPALAVYSYARSNRFNFPHPGVIENYKIRGVNTLAAAERGGIKVISLPGRIEIETTR